MDRREIDDFPDGFALRRVGRQVRMRLLVRLSALHVIGGLVVFTYLQQVYPASEAFRTPWLDDFALLVISEAVLGPVAWVWVGWHFRRTSGWALDGRLPTPHERQSTLKEPWRMAARPFLLWIVATAGICTAIAVRGTYDPRQIAEVGQIMVIGGVAVSAVSYLVLEQTYRPLFSFALAGQAPPTPASLGIRPRLLLAWAVSSGIPLLGLTTAPLRETGSTTDTMAALALIGLLGRAVHHRSGRELDRRAARLRSAMRSDRVRDGDLTPISRSTTGARSASSRPGSTDGLRSP